MTTVGLVGSKAPSRVTLFWYKKYLMCMNLLSQNLHKSNWTFSRSQLQFRLWDFILMDSEGREVLVPWWCPCLDREAIKDFFLLSFTPYPNPPTLGFLRLIWQKYSIYLTHPTLIFWNRCASWNNDCNWINTSIDSIIIFLCVLRTLKINFSDCWHSIVQIFRIFLSWRTEPF